MIRAFRHRRDTMGGRTLYAFNLFLSFGKSLGFGKSYGTSYGVK